MAENAWLNFYCETDKRTRVASFHLSGKEWQITEVSTDPLPEGGEVPGRIEMKGTFGIAKGYEGCPGCGADSYVRCGTCNELGCWRSGTKWYTCPGCGVRDRVGGTLTWLNAMDVA